MLRAGAVALLASALSAQMRTTVTVSGRVALEDGAPLPEPAEIVCDEGKFRTYTDRAGNFRFRVDLTGMAARSPATVAPQCGSVYAALHGYRSRTYRLQQHSPDWLREENTGTLILRRLIDGEGDTVSVTTLAAPANAREAFDRGVRAARERKFPAALKQLENAVRRYPQFAAAWCELGRVHEALENWDGARAAYRKAAGADPGYVTPLAHLASLESRLRNWPAALDATAAVITLSPEDFPDVHYLRAVALWTTGNSDAALDSAGEAVRLDGARRFPRSACLLGSLYAEKGASPDAIQAFRLCLEHARDPKDAALAREQIHKLGAPER